MAKPLPEHTEIRFVETLATGVVHIETTPERWVLASQAPEKSWTLGQSDGAAFAAIYETPTVVRCGLKVYPHRMEHARHQYTDRFPDDRLCAACYRTLHPDDQERAFDHPRPGDEDDDEEPAAA